MQSSKQLCGIRCRATSARKTAAGSICRAHFQTCLPTRARNLHLSSTRDQDVVYTIKPSDIRKSKPSHEMQTSQQILTGGRKLLNFFAPVYKPAGLCSMRLSECIKLDLYFVLEHHGIKHEKIIMNTSRFLEPFASGVVTYIVGTKDAGQKKNFVLASYSCDLTVEFGVERQLLCIDGPVIQRISTKDLNETRIRNELPNFQGKIKQDRLKSYRLRRDLERDPLQILNNPDWNTSGLTSVDIINRIDLSYKKKKSNTEKQKYPYVLPPRDVTVESIELVNFKNPYADFRIKCNGSFMPRRFVFDLASKLGTQASIVSMCRTKEGPISHDDLIVLQPHELNFDYYVNRLPIYKELYGEFNRQLDPLWENISDIVLRANKHSHIF